jgi:hypothetical protein
MKHSLSEVQKQKIRAAYDVIKSLQQVLDTTYKTLITDLRFQDYEEAWLNNSDSNSKHKHNPADWLFDILHNSNSDVDIDDRIEHLEKQIEKYNS